LLESDQLFMRSQT